MRKRNPLDVIFKAKRKYDTQNPIIGIRGWYLSAYYGAGKNNPLMGGELTQV